jgi:Na+/H+-dicarboxylate symporter
MKALRNPAAQIGIAAVAGILFGLLVGEWAANLKFVGDLFIRLIQMAIVPLVMASVIVATGSISGKGTGKLALRTFSWMIGFSIVAAGVAVGLSLLFQPGVGMEFSGEVDPALEESASQAAGWQDTILGFVSTNIFAAMSTATMVPIIIFSLIFGAALNSYAGKTGNTLLLSFFEQLQEVGSR